MNNGDDIHNLLRTLGHDAGIYQDLAQYNASRAAVRRAAMARPAEPPPTTTVQPPQPAQARAQAPATLHTSELPQVLRVGRDPQGSPASLSSILNRLASPTSPAPAHGTSQRPTVLAPTAGVAPAQPTRLDRLFGRLASRSASPLRR